MKGYAQSILVGRYDYYSVGGFAANGRTVGSEFEPTEEAARECAAYLSRCGGGVSVWGWRGDECDEVACYVGGEAEGGAA